MRKTVGLVIPLYKERPDALEHLSLKRCAAVLGRYPTMFLVPEGMDISFYQEIFTGAETVRFSPTWFTGLESYNRLLLSDAFYERFSDRYEKICIVQPDVFVLYDALEEFCRMPYDYFGAPMSIFRCGRYEFYGGNGGMSLRDVDACRRILIKAELAAMERGALEEDEYFSLCGEVFPEAFRVAPLHVAVRFAFDRFPRLLMQVNGGRPPMALHGWYTYDRHFCRSLLAEELPKGLDFGIENENVLEKEKFHRFLQVHKQLVFYGAGNFGKSFLQYIQSKGFDIESFIVSDDQRKEECYRDKPIEYLSHWRGDREKVGVVIVLGRLIQKKIANNLIRQGFKHIFVISEILCNAVLEEILLKRFHTEGQLEEFVADHSAS